MTINKEIILSNDRWVCQVLEDMRTCDKNKNYAALTGLIAEAQTYCNRMEEALECRGSHPTHEDLLLKQMEVKLLDKKANALANSIRLMEGIIGLETTEDTDS